MFKNLLNILHQPIVFCSLTFFKIFSSLYIGSAGNTEVELKNYFSFPRKDILVRGFEELNTKIKLNLNCCILFKDEIEYNPKFCKDVSLFTNFRKIDKKNILQETININKIIYSSNPHIKKIISSSQLEKLNVLLITYGRISPTLCLNDVTYINSPFNSAFQNENEINLEYVIASNQMFGYIQNNMFEILEIICEENIILGIVKTNINDIELNKKYLHDAIKNLKPVHFKSIKIPLFNVRTKLKFKNMLKETNADTIFESLEIPELFNSDCKLSEVLQNFEFSLEKKLKKINISKNDNFVTSKEFVANASFLFYIKIRKMNTLIMLGIY